MAKFPVRRRKGHGEVVPPLSTSDRIDSLLKEHLAIFPSKSELTEGEIEHWHRDLGQYQTAAIEWAFDTWRRNGHFFPVYADITSLCEAWNPPELERKGCDAACRRRHHQGYGEVDVKYLNSLVVGKIMAEGRTREQRLTDSEIDALLDQVDTRRGSHPMWRQDGITF